MLEEGVMPDNEMEVKALEAARATLANLSPRNLQIRNRVQNFLDGALFFVYYQHGQDSKEYLIYAYVRENNAIIINSIEELAKVMSVYRPEKVKEVFSVRAISGTIALLVTITICYLIAYQGVKDPPQILSAALTAILGFYFGSQVASKKTE
jgi:hypothetical protein